MPTYEYLCEDCDLKEEHIHTMTEVADIEHECPTCDKVMRRLVSGGLGVIFRGDGWIDKELRRTKEDRKIQQSRRQAMRLKTSGAVPWKETIKIEAAEGMYDRLGTEMRKKEAKKAEGGALDKEMDAQIASD